MKKIFLMIIVAFFALQMNAQLSYDKWGNVVPISLTEEYEDYIDSFTVPSLVIPYMNNDSLCRKYNDGKTFSELGSDFVRGITINHKPISLKKNGVCIKLEAGKLWRYAIEGVSAGGISFDLGFPKLSKGSYIAVFALDSTYLIQSPKIYHSENLKDRFKKNGLRGAVSGKKLIMEYYEPDSLKMKENIVIKSIGYDFVAFGDRDPSSFNSPNLKSGFWGSSEFSNCQTDVVCKSYANEAKSVVFLYLAYRIEDQLRAKKATGFFINKVGGYNENDNPILITAGHVYSYFINDLTPVDLLNYQEEFFVVTNYQNVKCGVDDTDKRGILLDCLFTRLALGSSYNEFGLPMYSANKDYSVLQATSSIAELSKYNIGYAAWDKNYDFNDNSNIGYFCIHHPRGDVKKINIDNDRVDLVGFDAFQLKYDLGLLEEGSSGSPVFNSARKIVGYTAGIGDAPSCSSIGQLRSANGMLKYLYYDFSSILDPTGIGIAQSSNPLPPTPEELPNHCRNCVQDEDETAMDCGGSCYPCGIQDVLTIKGDRDLLGTKRGRYEIYAEPDPGSLLCLKSNGTSSLKAGMSVFLNGGFEVQKGATFYADIDAELMSEPDRGCQDGCVYPANVFTPNGDGINDYWGFSQSFITEYSIDVFNRWGNLLYSEHNRVTYENSTITCWDGGNHSNGVYTILISYVDCNGNTGLETVDVTLFGEKSAEITKEEVGGESSILEANLELEYVEPLVKVFPNPVDDKINISYTGDTFPLEYQIFDANGKVIIENIVNSNYEELDMHNYTPGNYIFKAKAGECNLIQKLIKK